MGLMVCVNHPFKPANKKCKICNEGLCKWCKARLIINYAGDNDGFICEKCDNINSSKTVHL